MKRLLATAAFALALSGAACTQAGAPDSVDKMARSEVEKIIADYLVQHPEALEAGLKALEEKHRTDLFAQLVSSKEDPTLGPADAPITIVEFTDYNCGYCRMANQWVMDQLDDRRGDVRVIFKEFPIRNQTSVKGAQLALAAARQGKYRETHIALMNAPSPLTDEVLDKVIKSVGLDAAKAKKDMDDPKFVAVLERVYDEAHAAGIEGTPAFFINGEFLSGLSVDRLNDMMKEARKES